MEQSDKKAIGECLVLNFKLNKAVLDLLQEVRSEFRLYRDNPNDPAYQRMERTEDGISALQKELKGKLKIFSVLPEVKYDSKHRALLPCKNCKKEMPFKHIADMAHGISGAYMSGTERYECTECGHAIYSGDNLTEKLDLEFRYE
ncbi:hypothetical protein A2926_03890 [Candidatus Giovannonibacteria bacterium RIFCSPLOWO2_01_FULL_44_40]|uniref:Uncharacterized protein n=1 Tax=Candidatus Giovannonibacteria bacterium RIFCSPHIGHO2_01_FULL_45_23 TaxID=1798325 RepID=A0A1F5VIV4_9BACT|nr:MAG: hypothetical protein A2834_04260 [Candidatus Giovannonibacteria bacterium RIFCSPHIGHO2_01_FULL_45_23]OGF80052.1 MAG: hypothetical protein A2926_03890 [Candidatus Giovannonibacteria bacterium RIFCSPLOWO2_01_FULL_44_40]